MSDQFAPKFGTLGFLVPLSTTLTITIRLILKRYVITLRVLLKRWATRVFRNIASQIRWLGRQLRFESSWMRKYTGQHILFTAFCSLVRRMRPVFLDRLSEWQEYAAANEHITGELQDFDLFYISRREAESHCKWVLWRDERDHPNYYLLVSKHWSSWNIFRFGLLSRTYFKSFLTSSTCNLWW